MNKLIQRFFLTSACLMLSNCSSLLPELRSELPLQKPTDKVIELAPGVQMQLANVWPLKGQGTYLQRIKSSIGQQQYTLTVHITLEPTKLEFVAFNDMMGRLYSLKWTPDQTLWEASDYIPDTMRPENIIGDFLLVHLEIDQLKANIKGADVIEHGNERIIQTPSGIVRKITRFNRQGDLWQKARIQNPKIGYNLDIETLPTP
ncbi:DUF3261 domain-containing protein [Candidatus Odyssella acanthamoebae]|uniref:DUF3261 domain-containing protein n=1 Tax=Candidatus Odyssella acanthamoebae TaxID=91604 RepID=A0A077AWH3_9PROT|nr:DUF3261 domain-containing protein [Candidatus Paracaedibacter acanthamoebae]AIK96374.1 hypothetical protein ID47_05955 [Candidatus Paracaedibacter acanthamoebae]